MAGLKEIKRRLVSVKNTSQITRAMKLVSAAKLARAQEAVTKSQEYAETLQGLMRTILSQINVEDVEHPLLQKRDHVKKVRLVVVGGSRGLCGAYNTNVNKAVAAYFADSSDVEIETVIVGKKPAEYYRRVKRTYLQSHEALPEDPNLWPLAEITENLKNDYISGEIDEAYLIFTHFKTVMSQQVRTEKILPFAIEESKAEEIPADQGLTIFEPSQEEVFANLIPRLMRVKIQQACLESKASEHASRMTAMDSATKNAGELKDKLQLLHNRLRQSGITGELLDIVGGVEALNN